MKARSVSIIALSIAGLIPFQARSLADQTAQARQAIQQIYNRRDQAAQKKDIQGALATVAPDFVFVAKDGQKGDVKLLKRRLTPLFSLVQSVKSRHAIQSFHIKGTEASASVKQHLEMVVMNPQTQMPQKLVADATTEDVWAKSGSGWLQKRMTTTSEKAQMDGRSVDDKINVSGKPSGTAHSGK